MSSALLIKLAKAYAAAAIDFPQLRAVTFAQWLLESGRATSDLATHHYNFGGLKWRPELKPFAAPVEYGANDGVDLYARFESLEKFIAGYWAFIGRAPYAGFKDHVATGADFIRFVGPIYCPSNAGYADDVLGLVAEAQGLLGGGVQPAPSPAPPPAPSPAPSAGGAVLKPLGAIVLDPGHGGTQKLGGSSPNNAISISGVLEKNLALDFCKLLRDELVRQAKDAGESVDVFLTREKDVNVGIKDRAKLAGQKNAKLFLSLHFNGFHKPAARGVETYYADAANGNTNEAADKAFAGAMHKALLDGMRAIDPSTPDRTLKSEILSGPKRLGTLDDVALGNSGKTKKCLAAYYEVEFITNPAVETLLISGPKAAANRTAVMGSVAKAMLAQIRTMP